MALGNEKIKSIILTTNRDFRAKSVGLLNNLAFASEKLSANSLDEIRVQLNRDRTLQNVVIDATSMTDPEFGHFAEKWDDVMKGKEARAIVFYQETQKALIEKHGPKISAWAHTEVLLLPQTKPQYAHCFYTARKQAASAIPGAQVINSSEVHKPSPNASAAPNQQQQKNASFFEASQHVRDTIDSLNNILKDRSALADLVKVGQRFNGMIGAFAFFGDKDGYRELVKLSDAIDTVARMYQSPCSKTEATEEHVNFVLDSAKCAYIMLKELRETATISAGTNESFQSIIKKFDGLNDVRKKDVNDQDDIDKMLEAAQKAAS